MRKRNLRWVVCTAALLVSGCVIPGSSNRPTQVGVDVPAPPHAPVPPRPIPEPLDETLHAAALRSLSFAADSNDPDLRANAIEALQKTSPNAAYDVALTGLSDSDENVRFAACMAVGSLHITEAHNRLLAMRQNDPSQVVQVGVRFALHSLGDKRFSHDLEGYSRSPFPQIRGKTALVLGLLHEPSAVVVLRPMRHDTQDTVRLQASASLWLLGDSEGLDDLLSGALSGYPDDLILATLSLAEPRDQRVAQHVRANLTTDYPEVNLAAARAMGMLGSDEGYVIAMDGTKSSDPRQRFLAALALGAIGRSDAQQVLATLLTDPNRRVQVGAATALLELHDPTAEASGQVSN